MPYSNTQTIQVIVEGRHFLQTTQNSFYFQWIPDLTDTLIDAETVGTLFIASTLSEFVECCSSLWSTVRILVRDPRTPPLNFTWETATITPGTVTGGSCPPSVSGVITRRGQTPSKHQRGRVFIPAVPLLWHAAGLLSETGVTAYNALATELQNTIMSTDPAGQLRPVVWSQATQLSSFITQWVVRPVLHSQRRRAIGHGV